MNEWKATKVLVHTQYFSVSFPAWGTYWSLTPQLETVIIEVSTVQVLRWKTNPLWLHRAIHLPSRYWTYGDTGFYGGQTSHPNIKALTFPKNEKYATIFELLLTWVMLIFLWPHKLHPDSHLWSLVLVYFLVADYRYSMATLSYKSLEHFSKMHT